MQEEALADIAADAARPEADALHALPVSAPEWHQGVVGIVASRLKDRYHRPAIVFARGSGGELKGSGRSIAGFHLRDALDLVAKRAPGVVARFGGHAYAAGLSHRRTRRRAVRRGVRGGRARAALAARNSHGSARRTACSRPPS